MAQQIAKYFAIFNQEENDCNFDKAKMSKMNGSG
jgi:hypothetical protein